MKLAEESKKKFDIFFFSIVFAKLELIIRQLHKIDMIFHGLGVFCTQFYNIPRQKLVIYNLLKYLTLIVGKQYVRKIKQGSIPSLNASIQPIKNKAFGVYIYEPGTIILGYCMARHKLFLTSIAAISANK